MGRHGWGITYGHRVSPPQGGDTLHVEGQAMFKPDVRRTDEARLIVKDVISTREKKAGTLRLTQRIAEILQDAYECGQWDGGRS